MLSRVERAWLAGFFDGDGTVGIRASNGRWQMLCVGVQFANADREALEWIRDELAPTVAVRYFSHAPRVSLLAISRRSYVRATLKAILPYARIKREQIQIALAALDALDAKDKDRVWELRDALRVAKGPVVKGAHPSVMRSM